MQCYEEHREIMAEFLEMNSYMKSWLNTLILKYSNHDPTLPQERNFDLRDHNKDCDDTESVDLTLHLFYRHNLQRINNNPAAAALYFQVAFDAIVSTLFAVSASDSKSEQLPIHLDERRCIFGRLINFHANLEADQKGMPYYLPTPNAPCP